MFDDELPNAKKTGEFPRNLESMSIAELDEYVSELEAEIERVKGDATKKKASHEAAASIFK